MADERLANIVREDLKKWCVELQDRIWPSAVAVKDAVPPNPDSLWNPPEVIMPDEILESLQYKKAAQWAFSMQWGDSLLQALQASYARWDEEPTIPQHHAQVKRAHQKQVVTATKAVGLTMPIQNEADECGRAMRDAMQLILAKIQDWKEDGQLVAVKFKAKSKDPKHKKIIKNHMTTSMMSQCIGALKYPTWESFAADWTLLLENGAWIFGDDEMELKNLAAIAESQKGTELLEAIIPLFSDKS
ncbi:hypothetical protein M422DRAFT_52226 [Sphaerobolus stellatus SS14]|uniref:Unplaced genomic scaffold SPHSTscaffold_131, whole genome shotgun sequence n=1 Tax=Sphaerobolus stellatus (strain SS14) TaxID=990650 RepID=A0A0C9UXD3_SPHS4|nr:hypothetical protein M422DRAFT_52226 [Sphaerobolus stellatus SS14]